VAIEEHVLQSGKSYPFHNAPEGVAKVVRDFVLECGALNETVLQILGDLNIWSPVGGTVGEGLGGVALLEEVTGRGNYLELPPTPHPPPPPPPPPPLQLPCLLPVPMLSPPWWTHNPVEQETKK
jgi:hypothetical protein